MRKTPKKNGRPHKEAPAVVSTARIIEVMAADGRTVIGIAKALKTSKETLAKWLDEDPELAEAFARGKEIERYELHNGLRRAAKRGNIVAAIFLLKARHGYREGDQGDSANKVSITFTLPGAMKPEEFTVIQNEPAATNKPVSRKSIARS
jgi:hypothetical protein